jgi:hypothetical protein
MHAHIGTIKYHEISFVITRPAYPREERRGKNGKERRKKN